MGMGTNRPIDSRESAVRLKSFKERGWAKAFNEDQEPITSGFGMLGYLRLKVDDVIQGLGQFHCLGTAANLRADGSFEVASHDSHKKPGCQHND